MALRIEDYALIGDCQTGALVGKDGSIDWLCFPRFDSGACFASLLGKPENGRWLIAPAGNIRAIRRRYRGDTLVLETTFTTDEGEVQIIDWMPPRTEGPDLIRLVRGIKGKVRMRMDLTIRLDYGWVVPWVQRIDGGIRATAGPDSLFLWTPAPLHGENMHTVSDFTVREGEDIPFELAYAPTYGEIPNPHEVLPSLKHTESWWSEWSLKCTYQGEWKEAVMRSLIALKAMSYAPTGGIVAAVTTSLPEKIGSSRNWDYRYCWLRDATFTLYAFLNGGYKGEAHAWREWLVNSVAGKPSEMHIMYGLAGERRLHELELDWLDGYEDSKPVRIGNQAYKQHQLDVYGEVMDSLHLARREGLDPTVDTWRMQLGIMEFLERDWEKPDEGIWEVRGPQRHFTHSKVMAWVAVDRAIKGVEEFGLKGPVERWREMREKIHRQVHEKGFDPDLNSFVQFYGSKDLDASLLMLPLVGFIPADDPRMLGTVDAIEKGLVHNGFVDRYRSSEEVDGLPTGEGSFILCSFWLVDNLILQGRLSEAQEMFEKLLSVRNDVGLLSEEYDTKGKRLLGNFPQAFSHVGLINTALNLSRAQSPAQDRPHQ